MTEEGATLMGESDGEGVLLNSRGFTHLPRLYACYG